MSNPLVFMTSPDQIAFPTNAYTKANFLSCFHDSPFTKNWQTHILVYLVSDFVSLFCWSLDAWPIPDSPAPGRRWSRSSSNAGSGGALRRCGPCGRWRRRPPSAMPGGRRWRRDPALCSAWNRILMHDFWGEFTKYYRIYFISIYVCVLIYLDWWWVMMIFGDFGWLWWFMILYDDVYFWILGCN